MGRQKGGRLPLHNLEGIVSFGYRGTSPALMGACMERNVSLCYLTPHGKFLARVSGQIKGNVILRRQQFACFSDKERSLEIAVHNIIGKIHNARWVLERATRDHGMQVDVEALKTVSAQMKRATEAAKLYFSVFDELILQQKKDFVFNGRNRRPPTDCTNALLSFVYTLLTNMMASALETVGLDPYVGFFHTERPGRVSLALDMIEELRAVLADRFVLSLINKKMITKKGFTKKENGAVLMGEDARKTVLVEWQNKKKETLTHPYLKEKVEWGMVPYVQAMLLARYLRGDLDGYPPFLWK